SPTSTPHPASQSAASTDLVIPCMLDMETSSRCYRHTPSDARALPWDRFPIARPGKGRCNRSMSAAHQLSAGEIAEIARSVAARRRFRDEVMERLQRNLGYEGGWFHTLDPSLPLATGTWLGLEMDLVERARAGWQGYAPGLAPLLAASSAGGG